MAKEVKKKIDEAALCSRISKVLQEAVGISDTNIAQRQAEAFRTYMRKPMAGDEQIQGRSKYVSNEVQSAVDWSVSTVIRVFDSQREPVSFQPNTSSPEDAALAKQMTHVVNFVLRQKNKHVGFLQPWLTNAFQTGLGVTMVSFNSYTEQSLPQLVKGVTDQALVEIYEDEEAGHIEIVEVGEQYQAKLPANQAGMMPQMAMLAESLLPMVRDVKIRRNKKQIELNIENLAPEDFIVSKDAKFNQQTGGIRASLQGHKRVISRGELIDLGFDEAKVAQLPSANDDDESELAHERSEVTDYSQGVGDVHDDVLIYEIYTRMAIEDKKARHYRITIGGGLESKPILLGYQEVSKFYPYAAFCPFPTPNTLFGQGIFDRIGPEQAYISKMMRYVFDNLAQHSNPIKIINPNVTNPNDVLNLYPGAVVRSEDPTGGISYNQPAFSGGNALSVIQSVSGKLDFATGVGPNMIALNASDLQNSTATATSQRANASQTFMERICRWFAETGYAYLVKLIIDALVSNPEDAEAFIARLTDTYVPIQIDNWDPDMDVTANISFGVMNKDFNAVALNQILAQQMQAMQMGIVTPDKIINTLTKIAENAGFTNPYEFYLTKEEWQQNAQQEQANATPPQPSADTLGLIQIEQTKAQLRAQSDAAKRDFEMRKLIVTNDIERDRMAQEKWLKTAEITAKYGAEVDLARLQQEQAASRNDVDLAMATIDQQKEAMNRLAEIHQAVQAARTVPQMPTAQQGPA